MYDVAILTDLRRPAAGVVADVRAQAAAGLTTVLVHASPADQPFPAPIAALFRSGLADLATPADQVHATVLVIRVPDTTHAVVADRTVLAGPDWPELADPAAHVARLGLRPARSIPLPRTASAAEPPRRRVLLVGERADRLRAIARRLPADREPVLLTASPDLPPTGMLVEHLPAVPADRRVTFLRDRLRHLIDLHAARVVVLDGVPDDGLLAATADHPGVCWLWLRPAMWRRGVGEKWRGRSAAFDAVLEPGEFAAAGDEGWTVQDRAGVTTVAPITMLDRSELLPWEGDRPGLLLRGVEVAVPGFTVVEPEPRALLGIDLAVSTAGYTEFHELLAAGVPTVFLPDPRSGADDQLARARFAAAAGVALCAERVSDLDDVLAEAARPEVRAALAARCAELAFANGAAAAAELVAAR